MKRLLTAVLLLTASLSLTACSGGGYGKTEKIEDTAVLTQMNETISQATEYYFDTKIPTDVTFEYEGFKSMIPSAENKKEYIHHGNIFQAAITTDPVEGQISAYGGVLSPDNKNITGLILNVFNEEVAPQSYTDDQLKEIAINFLRTKELVGAEEEVTFVAKNDKASSTYITVLNFDSETRRFALGVNLQFGTVAYFEYADLQLFETPESTN